MGRLKIIISVVIVFFCSSVFAQKDSIPFFKGAIKANKEKFNSNLINKSIIKNLSLAIAVILIGFIIYKRIKNRNITEKK